MKLYEWNKAQKSITKWYDDKIETEFQVAKDLDKYFKTYPLIKMINYIAYRAIADLCKKADRGELKQCLKGGGGKFRFWKKSRIAARAAAVARHYKEEANYMFGDKWTNPEKRVEAFCEIEGRGPGNYFDPADCSDILCMYGEFIEDSPKKYPKSAKIYAPNHDKLKVVDGRTLIEDVAPEIEEDEKEDEKMSPALELKEEVKGPGLAIKDRAIVSDKPISKWTDEAYRQARRKPRYPEQWKGAIGEGGRRKTIDFFSRAHVAEKAETHQYRIRAKRNEVQSPELQQERLGKLKAHAKLTKDVKPGMQHWHLDQKSSIKQIDRMFGLIKGADISGTTGDTVFGIETLMDGLFIYGGDDKKAQDFAENALRIKEILYLLPLVTMTEQAHHALLECAFTLSINDYIDYSIGLYTTLVPKHWDQAFWDEKHPRHGQTAPSDRLFRSAVMELLKILSTHEMSEKNPLVLLYFDSPGGKPLVGYEFEKEYKLEMPLFWQVSNLRRNMAGWGSVLYGGDFSQRYPSQGLVEETIDRWANFLDIALHETKKKQKGSHSKEYILSSERSFKHEDEKGGPSTVDEEFEGFFSR